MAVKSVFEVDVRDGAFKAFAAVYQKYRDHLKVAPKEWANVAAGISKSRAEFDKLVQTEIVERGMAAQRLAVSREADRITRAEAQSWDRIAKSTKDITANIGRTTAGLLRWAGVTTLVSGLVGAGGLFGLDRLGAGVSSGRRSALGLGTGYGGQASFGSNFGRLVDPGSFLGAVAEGKLDVTKRVGLLGAGLTERQLQGDTASVSIELLRNLKRIADQTNPALYGQVIQARQLGGFTSVTDLNRLHNTSQGELEDLIKNYRRGESRFGLDDATARKWQDFTTQMDNAGRTIETVIIKGLTPLTPALTKLSESVATTIETFLSNPKLAQWMNSLGAGIEKFASYITTDEFQNGVRQFAEGVINIGRAIGKAGSWIGGHTRFGEGGNPEWDERAKRVEQMRKDRAEGKASSWDQFKNIFSGPDATKQEQLDYIRKGAIARGMNPDVWEKLVKSEGLNRYTGDYDATGKPTSFGPFQLHYPGIGRNTADGLGTQFTRETGLDARDPKTWKAQADWSLDYGKQNGLSPWHGWRGSPYAGGAGTGGGKTTIDINNNAGGSVNVNASQVAQ